MLRMPLKYLMIMMAIATTQALDVGRLFAENMAMRVQVPKSDVSSLADHAFFRYLNAKHSSSIQGDGKMGSFGIHWENCGDKSKEVVQIHNLTISPASVSFPENISVAFSSTLKKSIGAPLKLELEVQKKEWLWITIPCIENIGSCTYDDICEMLSGQDCPEIFVENKIPCKCPFKKGSYELPKTTLALPSVPVPSGEYRVTAKVSAGKFPVYCIYVELTVN